MSAATAVVSTTAAAIAAASATGGAGGPSTTASLRRSRTSSAKSAAAAILEAGRRLAAFHVSSLANDRGIDLHRSRIKRTRSILTSAESATVFARRYCSRRLADLLRSLNLRLRCATVSGETFEATQRAAIVVRVHAALRL